MEGGHIKKGLSEEVTSETGHKKGRGSKSQEKQQPKSRAGKNVDVEDVEVEKAVRPLHPPEV